MVSYSVKISIIIPALNEAKTIEKTLQLLQAMRQRGVEVILVDGNSQDQTCQIAEPFIDKLIKPEKFGRANQMNAGAEQVAGELLWFLHADTLVPENSDQLIIKALQKSQWGRFDVQLSGKQFLLRVVERMMNIRSCWSGITTGDQGIFISRQLFTKVAGFPDIPLMEDVEISKRLKQIESPVCIHEKLITSSRRWKENGIIKTIMLMWWLRFCYWLGVSPEKLNKMYS